MEVLLDVVASYFQQWSAAQVSIFVGLLLVFLELLKTNNKLEQLKGKTAKKGSSKPFTEFQRDHEQSGAKRLKP